MFMQLGNRLVYILILISLTNKRPQFCNAEKNYSAVYQFSIYMF